MRRLSWCLLMVLFAYLLVPSIVLAQSKKKSATTAVLMSALLPGAGQFYTRQPNKGLLMAGTYLGTMGLVIAYGPWTWEEEKKDEFFGELAEGTGTSGTTKAIWYGSVAVAGGVWLWSVIDASSSAKKFNQSLSFEPIFQKGQVGVSLTMAFDF